MSGGFRTYGYRTLVDGVVRPNWISLAASRLVMEFQARADVILETHVFDQIDGRGHLFGQIDGELTALCQEYYGLGSLFGDSPSEAFSVDTGDQVSTPTTIAAQEIHAQVALRISPFGELVVLDLIKVPVNQPVA